MGTLIKNIRFAIYTLSAVLALVIFWYCRSLALAPDQLNVRLVDTYAFAATIFLYLTLLISPLYSVMPSLPLQPLAYRAQRALGISAFFFALLHSSIAFFLLLGGFPGLDFLDSKYLLGICLSITALLILSLMAATSFDRMVSWLGPKWKILHRFVYLAGVLIVIHALMLGSNFIVLSQTVPQICLWLLVLLLLLEAMRFDKYIREKFQTAAAFSPIFVINIAILIFLVTMFVLPSSHGSSNVSSLGVHAQHILLAQQAQTAPPQAAYTATLIAPPNVLPGQNVQLSFSVQNLQTGTPITNFDVVQEKLIHLVIVNSELTYFAHIHPDLKDGVFSITTSFPKTDVYHLYISVQPSGGIEQQIGFTLTVGTAIAAPAVQPVDTNLSKIFGDYKIILAKEDDFRAADMSRGLQTVTFGILDGQTGQPVKNIQTYLGAFGHLVMINEKTYQYIHVHPSVIAQNDSDTTGPDVEFLPLGLTGAIQPGTYRFFAQFRINGQLVVADFTQEIK